MRDPAVSCDLGTFAGAVIIPGFPNCFFNVICDYDFCFTGSYNSFHLSDFIIDEYVCDAYNDSIDFHAANGTLAEFETRFNQQVWRQITLGLLSSNFISLGSTSFTYNIRSCTKSCYVEIDHGNELTEWRRIEMDCGSGCCKIRRNYRRENELWQLQSVEDLSDPSDCWTDDPQRCPLCTVYTTECRQKCDDLLF